MLKLDEKRFIKEYMKDLNPTNAYIRASGDEEFAKQKGAYLMRKLKKEINKEVEQLMSALDVDNNYVISNIKQILETSMGRSPIHTAEDGTPITSYDPTVALKATEQLGKYLKLFTDRTENINVQTDFEEYIKKVESEDEY